MATTILAAVVLLGLASAGRAQIVEAEIDQAHARLQLAKARDVHLIAPGRVGDAAEEIREARTLYEEGKSIEEIRERLETARQALDEAAGLEQVGRPLLDDALTARRDALIVDAPELAADEWSGAANKLRDAGSEIEDGDLDGARDRAREATEKFRRAELDAIRRGLLGHARRLRTEALEAGAKERAPFTFGEAESFLEQADETLKMDRYQRSEAREFARRANEAFRHATTISARSREIEERGAAAIERLILDHERQLETIAEAVGTDVGFARGTLPAADRVASAARSLALDHRYLQDELADANGQADSLRRHLAALEEVRDDESRRLEARREREEKVDEIRALFTPSEAEVFEKDAELVVRLPGLMFPSGTAELRSEDFFLLTKVRRALRLLGDSPVVIEGHTDSRGDEEYNRALSLHRAEAVTAYLLANTEQEAGRFSSLGLGETRPIASNETEEGRARNRRIDLRIALVPPEGGRVRSL